MELVTFSRLSTGHHARLGEWIQRRRYAFGADHQDRAVSARVRAAARRSEATRAAAPALMPLFRMVDRLKLLRRIISDRSPNGFAAACVPRSSAIEPMSRRRAPLPSYDPAGGPEQGVRGPARRDRAAQRREAPRGPSLSVATGGKPLDPRDCGTIRRCARRQ